MMGVFIGIDNGISGSCGIIDGQGNGHLFPTPTKSALNYQKTKVKHITRIDVGAFRELLKKFIYQSEPNTTLSIKLPVKVAIERPYTSTSTGTDGKRRINYDAMISGMRALEATIIVIESLGLGYEFCDSKAWQKELLPFIAIEDKKKYPGKLKQVSLEVGQRLYPNINWKGFKDADGILLATYLKLKNTGL